MNRFTYENQGAESMLVYRLGQEEHLDSFARGMLKGNEMEGILRPSFIQRDVDQYLKYPVTSKIPLKDFLRGEMEKEAVLRLCHSIACAMGELGEYMLSEEKIVLDPDYIFVDVRKKEASLVYLPVDEYAGEATIKEFLLMLLSHMRYQLTGDVSYVAKLIHFLNRQEHWEALELRRYIRVLLDEQEYETGAEKAPKENVSAPAVFSEGFGNSGWDAAQPSGGREAWQEPVPERIRGDALFTGEGGFNPIAQDLAGQEVEKEETKKRGLFKSKKKAKKEAERENPVISVPRILPPSSDPAGEREGAVRTPGAIQPEVVLMVDEDGGYLPDQAPAREKKKGGLFRFGKKKGKEKPADIPPVPMAAVPSSVNPPAMALPGSSRADAPFFPAPPAAPPEPAQASRPVPAQAQTVPLAAGIASYRQPLEGATVYMGHGSSDDDNRTVILGGGDYGSTVVLGSENCRGGASNAHVVRLTRRRNGQGKVINKELFRIGSEGNFVDFYIGDNPAIGACHADIFEEDGSYYITDRNSVNHTCVNGVMAPPMQAVQLKNGSVITLADEDFDFIIS